MTVTSRFATIASIGFTVVLSACGGDSSAGCRDAATAQAKSEQAWAAVIEAHNKAHVAATDHQDLEKQLLERRVDVIVAIESTREAC